MNFKEYQDKARQTAVYPKTNPSWIYPMLGLCGETGEIAEKLKKVIRDGNPIDKDALKKELGDVLWYIANLAYELGLDLENIAQTNIDKLFSRKERNCLHGSGDNR